MTATAEGSSHTTGHNAHGPSGRTLALAFGALGVVYGDIGTSPLYTIKECFTVTTVPGEPVHGVHPTPENVLGILSLVFWSLTLVIVNKYLTFIMRADNKGEGGTFALIALVKQAAGGGTRTRAALILLALFGASLIYGEGIITPAISVLSAVEGLEVAAHDTFKSYVVPITLAILVGLFLVQKRGTAGIGRIFGPATFVWFVTIAVAGAPWIARNPAVLAALNPAHAVSFFAHHGRLGFLVLGSVVLCITGGEALYADMGHFGKQPIRIAWYAMVFPALLFCYFGQGAMLLANCADVHSAACTVARANPFYALVSGWVIYPLVAIATVATVVASQALISGAFSLTQQAVQLGYCPRVTIVHTSGQAEGQIYIPEVNHALMVACLALVVTFQQSSRLAAAYGIAVTGAMSITSVLFYVVARNKWGWPAWKAGALLALFLAVDLPFFSANVAKFFHGGWLPILVGAMVFTLMSTWSTGREALRKSIVDATLPMDAFMESLRIEKPHRVKGTAVFMTQNPEGAPPALVHHFKHNQVLHKQVVLLSVKTENVPEVPPTERVELRELGEGFWHVTAHYGFMQTPHVPQVMRRCAAMGLKTDEATTSFYLGRETLLTTGRSKMHRIRKALFVFMSRNARPATSFFGLPPNRVVELGTQIEL